MNQAKEAWLKMADWCARQERCLYDVEQKLKALQIEETEKHCIIKKLSEENYVDDARYVKFYVQDKFRFNGWGKIKIQWQLSQKKVASTTIASALDDIDEETYENKLRDILNNKLKTIKGKDLWQTKAALLRFAQSRGFEYDLSNRLINQITQRS